MRRDPDEVFHSGRFLRLTLPELVREIEWLQADLSERRKRTPAERRELAIRAVRLLWAACGKLGQGPSYPAEARIITVHADFVEAFLQDYRSAANWLPHTIFSRAAEFAIERLQREYDAADDLSSAYWHYHRYSPISGSDEEGLRRALTRLYDEAVIQRRATQGKPDVLELPTPDA